MNIARVLRGTRVLCVVVAVAISACAGTRVEIELAQGLRDVEIDAVAVWPFTFRFQYEAYETYEKSFDMIQAVLARRRFLVLGPDDFEVTDTRGIHPFLASDLALRSARLSIIPRRLAVLRGFAEERVATLDKQLINKSGQVVGYRKEYEKTLVVEVAFFHPDTGERLVSARTVVDRDLFGNQQPFDTRPELRNALNRVLNIALDKLEKMVRTRSWRWADVVVRANPKPVFGYSTDNREPLSRKLGAMNFIEADALKFTRYQYFYPDLAAREFGQFERTPFGLLVKAVGDSGLREAGLKSGDVIIKVNDVEMTGEYRFRRAVALAKPGARLAITPGRTGPQDELSFPIK